MPLPTLLTFIFYFILLLYIGSYFYKKTVKIEDYLLGGRGMGVWVTALSAQASDMSGWLLMVIAVVSTMAWGLDYFGQPHILVRFMSIKSVSQLPRSSAIAIVWSFLSLSGAVAVEDFYQKAIKKEASEKEVVLAGRICVIIISIIALVLALNPENTVLDVVAYAWGGFGAAFGPLVLFALFSRKTTWQSAMAGMVVGTVVLVVWKQVGLGEKMYEIVPGFVANCLTIFIFNIFTGQKDEKILKEYNEVLEVIDKDAVSSD
jgi:Na+/proline symporter